MNLFVIKKGIQINSHFVDMFEVNVSRSVFMYINIIFINVYHVDKSGSLYIRAYGRNILWKHKWLNQVFDLNKYHKYVWD